MQQGNREKSITDYLLDVYNYSFIASVSYEFFLPRPDKYQAVNLTKRCNHCIKCKKEYNIGYDNKGLIYFSKSKFQQQMLLYKKLGLALPIEDELETESFIYHVEGYCEDCAQEILAAAEPGQKLCNIARELHREDEIVVAAARQEMEHIIEAWLSGIHEAQQLAVYDLSTNESMRDALCAIILQNTSSLAQLLDTYMTKANRFQDEAQSLLAALPSAWQAYVATTSLFYESMSDEFYNEYTVAFPAAGTLVRDFYVMRQILRDKAELFLSQKRISSLSELIMEAGFSEKWVDMLLEKGLSLQR